MQLAGLLQMSGREADKEHIDRLERQLVQARNEIDALNTRLDSAEKQQGVSRGLITYKNEYECKISMNNFIL